LGLSGTKAVLDGVASGSSDEVSGDSSGY
jgi:hypothetical protein